MDSSSDDEAIQAPAIGRPGRDHATCYWKGDFVKIVDKSDTLLAVVPMEYMEAANLCSFWFLGDLVGRILGIDDQSPIWLDTATSQAVALDDRPSAGTYMVEYTGESSLCWFDGRLTPGYTAPLVPRAPMSLDVDDMLSAASESSWAREGLTTFRIQVMARDKTCIVSQYGGNVAEAAHLIPRSHIWVRS